MSDIFTDQDRAALHELNRAVHQAMEKRTAWLDAKIAERAPAKVGDPLYDIDAGLHVGNVTAHARHHRGSLFDNSLSWHYEYAMLNSTPWSRIIDNTSRQYDRNIGSYAEMVQRQELLARRPDLRANYR